MGYDGAMSSSNRIQKDQWADSWPTLAGTLLYLAASFLSLSPGFVGDIWGPLGQILGLGLMTWGAGQSIRRQGKHPALAIILWGLLGLATFFFLSAIWYAWQAELLRRGAGG